MADKVRLQLSTSMAGPNVSHKHGTVITVDADEAKRHVANGNGTILEGPADESEINRLRADLAQARAALAGQGTPATNAAKK